MKLIDADELKKNFQDELCKGIACAECSMQAEGFCRAERWIDNAPTVEVEPVVHCKDCKWCEGEGSYCRYDRLVRTLNDFCSRGEKVSKYYE